MGWTDKLKNAAVATAAFTKVAAKTTANYAKETYNDLASRPTEMYCTNEECHKLIVIPPLTEEEQKKEASQGDEFIICGDCNTNCKIPSSKFTKSVGNAVYTTKKTAKSAGKAIKNEYHELSSRPKFIYCKDPNCREKIDVPPLEEEENVDSVDEKQKKKEENLEEFMMCPKCDSKNKVPKTKFRETLSTGGYYTKKAATTTATYAKDKYKHLKSAPEIFNCEHCNTKLHVPTVEGKVLDKCKCPTCSKETAVPKSNFTNSLNKTATSIGNVGKNVVYAVKKAKHAKCANCSQQTKIPDDAKQDVVESENEVTVTTKYVCQVCDKPGELIEKTRKEKVVQNVN